MKCVGNYQLQKLIGSGQYGKVYKSVNQKTLEEVAIKVVNKQFLQHEKIKQLFQQEIGLMFKLSNNNKSPNIVKLMEYLESPSNCYLVMEFCEGGDLQEYLNQKNHFDENEAIIHLKEILSAFQAMHEQNIMHRDFKTANVFLKDGVFKIGDFGFAKQLSEITQMNETILGTPYFMAPELLEKQRYTNKTDIWAIGIVFYQMIFGALPFYGNSQLDLYRNIIKHDLNFKYNSIEISKQTQELISRMLEISPEKRLSWQELFNYPILNQTNNNSQSFSELSLLLFESQDFSECSKFYKDQDNKVQEINYIEFLDNLAAKPTNPTLQMSPEIQTQEDLSSPKQPKQTNNESINILNNKYKHERKKNNQIIFTIFNVQQIDQNTNNQIYIFFLAKYYFLRTYKLQNNLTKKNNQFDTIFFEQYLKSKYYTDFQSLIYTDYQKTKQLYDEQLLQAEKLINDPQFQLIYIDTLETLKKYVDNKLQNDYEKVFQQFMKEYINQINMKLMQLKQEQKISLATLYAKLIYQIFDILLLDELFLYNEVQVFNFEAYNCSTNQMNLQQFEKCIELKKTKLVKKGIF